MTSSKVSTWNFNIRFFVNKVVGIVLVVVAIVVVAIVVVCIVVVVVLVVVVLF